MSQKKVYAHPCCVQGCKDLNSSRHVFPKQPVEYFDEWVRRSGNPKLQRMSVDEVRKGRFKICGSHFSDNCRMNNFRRLLNFSLPTLNLPGNLGTTVRVEFFNSAVLIDQSSYSPFVDLKASKSDDVCVNSSCKFIPDAVDVIHPHDYSQVSITKGDDTDMYSNQPGFSTPEDPVPISVIKIEEDEDIYSQQCGTDLTSIVKVEENEDIFTENSGYEEDEYSSSAKIEMNDDENIDINQSDHESTVDISSAHKGRKEFACPLCDYKSNWKRNLENHPGSVHGEKKDIVCGLCGFEAEQKHLPKFHVDLEHSGKGLSCPLCNYKATQKSHLRNHISSVHEGKKYFGCPFCDHKATRKVHLRSHISSVHEGKKDFGCPFCDYKASRNDILKSHIKTVHEGRRDYGCGLCSYKSNHLGMLKRHIISVHEGKKDFPCPFCDYKASLKSRLKCHVKSVHKGKKDFACPLCDYKAAWKGSIERHMRLCGSWRKGNRNLSLKPITVEHR